MPRATRAASPPRTTSSTRPCRAPPPSPPRRPRPAPTPLPRGPSPGKAAPPSKSPPPRGATFIPPLGPSPSPAPFALSPHPDGPYTSAVRQSAPAGNTSPFVTSDYVLDTTVQAAPAIAS